MKCRMLMAMLAALFVSVGANAQMQVDMTPNTGKLQGGASKVVTSVFTVELKGGKVVKTGKPDPWGEVGVYPQDAVQTFDKDGRLLTSETEMDGVTTKCEYAYTGDNLTEEKRYDNGALFSVKRYSYVAGKLSEISEDMFIGGEKSTNVYPVDNSKIKTDAEGNTVEYGYSESDYVKKDKEGKIVEFSMNNEMDETASYYDCRDRFGEPQEIIANYYESVSFDYIKQQIRKRNIVRNTFIGIISVAVISFTAWRAYDYMEFVKNYQPPCPDCYYEIETYEIIE